jgi:excisionase family DNA binding protein
MTAMTLQQLLELPAAFNVATTARALGVSEWTVREMDRRGELPAIRLGRLKRWRLVDVLDLLGVEPTLATRDGPSAEAPNMSGRPGHQPERTATATHHREEIRDAEFSDGTPLRAV